MPKRGRWRRSPVRSRSPSWPSCLLAAVWLSRCTGTRGSSRLASSSADQTPPPPRAPPQSAAAEAKPRPRLLPSTTAPRPASRVSPTRSPRPTAPSRPPSRTPKQLEASPRRHRRSSATPTTSASTGGRVGRLTGDRPRAPAGTPRRTAPHQPPRAPFTPRPAESPPRASSIGRSRRCQLRATSSCCCSGTRRAPTTAPCDSARPSTDRLAASEPQVVVREVVLRRPRPGRLPSARSPAACRSTARRRS